MNERGFSLPELLVATAVSLVVIAGGMALLSAAMKRQPATSERASQIQQGRVMAETLVRELRQGEAVSGTATSLVVVTYANSTTCGGAHAATAILCRVTYSCASHACTRTEARPDGSAPGPAVTVVRGIADPSVFSYTPATTPSYVSVRLGFADDGGHETVTLEDGTALRNWFEAS